MRKIIIYTSVIWISIVFLYFLQGWIEIYNSNIFFENILKLFVGFAWIVPILLIFLIKEKLVRYILLASVMIILFVCGLWSLLFIVDAWVMNDLLTGNGFNQIYEKKISDNRYFSVYITPGMGGLGGSWDMYTIDKKLPFGFVNRHKLTNAEFKCERGSKLNTEIIIIGKDTVTIDSDLIEKKMLNDPK